MIKLTIEKWDEKCNRIYFSEICKRYGENADTHFCCSMDLTDLRLRIACHSRLEPLKLQTVLSTCVKLISANAKTTT